MNISSDAIEVPQAPPLRPQPDLSGRIKSIDGLRALAMLLVFIFHAWHVSDRPSLPVSLLGISLPVETIIRENTRVALFIVLSGFCLFLPFCKRPESMQRLNVSQYYWHRFQRIAPPYYAALLYPIALSFLVMATYQLLGLTVEWPPIPTWWQYLTHFLFVHTLFTGTWMSVNGSLWTLGLEGQFYLVFPLLIFGFCRWGVRLIPGLVLGSIVYSVAARSLTHGQSWEVQTLSQVFFAGRMMQFALGMGAAWFVFRWRERRAHLNAWTGTFLALGALGIFQLALMTLPKALGFLPWRNTALGLAFALGIVALSISVTPFRWLFENQVMARLGLISYSLFLVHYPTLLQVSEILTRFFHTSGRLHFYFLSTVGFAATLIIGGLFYWFIERPFIGHAKRSAARRGHTPSVCRVTAGFPAAGQLATRP